MTTTIEELGPVLARWLAPYVAAELGHTSPPGSPTPADYDDAVCAQFVSGLGVNPLNRARDFFAKLDADGAVDSQAMAVHLSLGTPRNISSALTTPIKRRAKNLGLGLPWRQAENSAGRTVWIDRDGIAARMLNAVTAESNSRFAP